MRILIITFEFPPKTGGISTYTYELAKYFSLIGHDITVLAYSAKISDKEIYEFDSVQTLRIIRFKNFKNKVLIILNRFFLTWNTVKKFPCDLLFITYSHAGFLGMIFKKIYEIPYVMFGHGSEFHYRNLFLKKIIQLIYKNADLIITNSNYTKELIHKSRILNKNLHVVPLGANDQLFDYNKYRNIDFKKQHKFTDYKIVLTVSKLSKRKGHHLVINAIDRLRSDIKNILYLIVGTGPLKSELEKLVMQKGLEKYVKFVGHVPDHKLPQYYALCDVFILNSIHNAYGQIEGFGIVLIEANLMKKPVIGVLKTGMTDAIENFKNGLLIQMNNVDETTCALRKLLLNPELRERLGDYGYYRAKKDFTWRQVFWKTNKIIENTFS